MSRWLPRFGIERACLLADLDSPDFEGWCLVGQWGRFACEIAIGWRRGRV